ncbi:peptidoglycan DD-metalloendopeptidase family protein [Cytophagaceae bacterium DM2B3-1]|uniref:Peptidoglycan DD-metalloendopeptidase family protein n=1 Tax=Xanthocytophaga flava TaxID=3048013 RepID=A0ABT7CCU6_9BACT|nr:peptidoglycan DD-metalloendopeptidase family protein [Xanthocytophaga flavus]MDJ1491524.1 peptidoglycan DD-metalloendopeptidase family protein [Xanthocytophaga flavus]
MVKNSISLIFKGLSFFLLPQAYRLVIAFFKPSHPEKAFVFMDPTGKYLLKIFACLLVVLATIQGTLAQKTRSQLEREKRQNLVKIAETNRILKETGAEKQASLGQLTALNEQITTQQGLINKISEELTLLDKEIGNVGQRLTTMENNFTSLQREYAAMLYAASKTTNSYNKVLFLFSSGSFTELLMRMKYLQQYSEARKVQLKQIEAVRKTLIEQRIALDTKKQEKHNLLGVRLKENKSLLKLKDKQNDVVAKLNAKEQELSVELAERKESVDKLEKLIAEVIAEELRKAAEREKAREALANSRRATVKKGATKSESSAASTSATISSTFEGAKSQLAWPVSSGFISSHFGRQSHPVLKNVVVEHHGVDIQTNKGEEVRAVYDGEVATITDIPGMHKLIMLKHGNEYWTVYAKLAKVNVERGQKVKAQQIIGQVYTDREGTSELQFQIWHNQEKLNPESWLQDK